MTVEISTCLRCARDLGDRTTARTSSLCETCRPGWIHEATTRATLWTREADQVREAKAIRLSPAFLERYRLVDVLGAGAMGTVYRAVDPAGAEVAIKFMLGDHGCLRERFLGEGQALMKVKSPRVVRCLEVGTVEDHPYLVTELMTGGSLRSLMDRGPIHWEDALMLGRDILLGLSDCHDRGIVHRDLKPANILLDGDRRAKIADLGIARDFTEDSRRTRAGVLLGTPRYMAPEQIHGQSQTATDIFAAAVVIYEMIARRPPFGGRTLVEVLENQRTRPADPLDSFCPFLPPSVASVLHRALAKDPAARPHSAREFAELLQRAAPGAFQSEPAPEAPFRLQDLLRQPGMRASLLVAGMIVLWQAGSRVLPDFQPGVERAWLAIAKWIDPGDVRTSVTLRTQRGEIRLQGSGKEELVTRSAALFARSTLHSEADGLAFLGFGRATLAAIEGESTLTWDESPPGRLAMQGGTLTVWWGDEDSDLGVLTLLGSGIEITRREPGEVALRIEEKEEGLAVQVVEGTGEVLVTRRRESVVLTVGQELMPGEALQVMNMDLSSAEGKSAKVQLFMLRNGPMGDVIMNF